tara:strand:- start:14805 stop:17546 length:2742 start_codon:yes stop_codon:yes gene_type:complete
MKNTLILIITCFLGLYCFAQNQASNWYFGENAGISFNLDTDSVTTTTDGRLNTVEGCTSISDDDGNLQFYTDGSLVWNKNHVIMSNGTGLIGNFSSTQSAIIVPKPKNTNIYYIFTVDDIKNNNDPTNLGLNYSEVDMSLEGGLGAVTNKNINLVKECSEKVTAVLKDCISESIWVVTLASQDGISDIFNTFYAYEISITGVSTIPNKSTFPSLAVTDGRGYLKLSPDGSKMACANASDGLFIYDFDVDTGDVSNQLQINSSGNASRPYGVEFSPNSELLYIHYSNDFFGQGAENPSNHRSRLIQYDLTSANIENSGIIIDDRQLYRGGLQLGPNGKIYRALSSTYNIGLPFLGVINNPNNIGLDCNYQHNAINLSPNNSTQGLPPFITSFFAQKIDIIGNNGSSTSLPLCEGDTYFLSADDIPGASYTWTRNGALLTNTNYNLLLQNNEGGLYKVFIDLNTADCNDNFEGIASVTFNPNPTAYDAELIQCDEDGILGGFTRFNLNQANEDLTGGISNLSTRFFTNASRSNSSEILNSSNYNYDADNPSLVYVEVYDTNTNCFDTSELTLNLSLQQIDPFLHEVCDELNSEDGINTFNLTNITTSIQSDNGFTYPITYYKTQKDAILEENDLGLTSYTNTSSPYSETIYARVENDNACFGIITVLLKVNVLPDIDIKNTSYYCTNFFPKTITLNAGLINNNIDDYYYAWSNGDTGYETLVNVVEPYAVTVTNKITGCSKERIITVEPSNIATFESITVVDVTSNNTITVNVSGEGIYEYALYNEDHLPITPYQESNIFENVSPGFYNVYVKDIENNCGIVDELVSVIGFPKFFTPNNDGFNDTWQVSGVSRMFQPNTKILIYNRYGKLVKEVSPLGEGWNGTSNGTKLPSDDYWFSITLQDGRIFKNHFTLKY